MTTNAGLTPLAGAVIVGAKGIIKLLLTHPNIKADAKNYHGSTPLIMAVLSQRPEIVSLLERDDVDINYVTDDGETPLLLAARRRNANITKLLLDHGADTEINRELLVAAMRKQYLSVLKGF